MYDRYLREIEQLVNEKLNSVFLKKLVKKTEEGLTIYSGPDYKAH